MKVVIESRWASPNETWTGEVDPDELRAIGGDVGPESCYRFFNRVDRDDERRLQRLGYRLPSLSVGDRVTLDGKCYEVEPMGFQEVQS